MGTKNGEETNKGGTPGVWMERNRGKMEKKNPGKECRARKGLGEVWEKVGG